mmetsp:Transcript_7394/g.18149  ORF Transcript_7394/g.18149 Transcript_7394/m.18149 type:complete len:108 (-) Transcript_7394:413-736(-)
MVGNDIIRERHTEDVRLYWKPDTLRPQFHHLEVNNANEEEAVSIVESVDIILEKLENSLRRLREVNIQDELQKPKMNIPRQISTSLISANNLLPRINFIYEEGPTRT